VFGDWRAVKGITTWYLENDDCGPTTVEGRSPAWCSTKDVPANRFKMPQALIQSCIPGKRSERADGPWKNGASAFRSTSNDLRRLVC